MGKKTYFMNRTPVAAWAVALLLVGGVAAAATYNVSTALPGRGCVESFVAGEVVVLFNEGVSTALIDGAVAKAGAEVAWHSIVTPTRVVVRVPAGKEDDFIAAYKRKPGVRMIEKNYIYHAFWTPNDPSYQYQWHYNKPDFIYAEKGWDVTRGDPSVIVAVVDTGVAYENYAVPAGEQSEVVGSSYAQAPDLAGTSFVAGYDFVHNDAHPNDQNGHGTHVSGTIAQTTDNAADVAGLAHKCSIMPIQVLDYSGSGAMSAIADGIDFARQNGADVINMSLGGESPSDILKNACDNAMNAGVVVLAATGNSEMATVFYPAAYDSVIAVGSVDYNGDKAWYSNYGLGIDCVAPGGDTAVDLNGDGYADGVLQMTYTTIYNPQTEERTNVTAFSCVFFQGTSMACPHAAALCALIISTGVTNYNDVKDKLLGSCTDLGASGYDIETGYGLINCEKSLGEGVPEVSECGDCGSSSSGGETLAYLGLFSFSYALVFASRKLKRKK